MSAADGMMLWTGDYLADTQHLTTTQHGAYMLILIAMWRNGGSLPTDERRLARCAGLAMDKWRKIGREVMELLTVEDNQVTQKRLQQELKKTIGKIEKRRSAGHSGGVAKSLKIKEVAVANATFLLEQKATDAPETKTRTKKEEEKNLVPSEAEATTASKQIKPKKRHAYPPEFEVFWKGYPTDANMGKFETYEVWKKISEEERSLAIKSLPAFCEYCRKNPDYRPVHALRYLSKKRFEGHAQAADEQQQPVTSTMSLC